MYHLSGTVNGNYYYGYQYHEYYLLAKIIHAEARGEGIDGMVAVGAVVLNRVNSEDFPDTIEEVILQPRQFSSVSDGQYHLEPGALAFQAAHQAIMGNDPTGGCLYFYNPDIATASWSFQRETEVVIGSHRFTR